LTLQGKNNGVIQRSMAISNRLRMALSFVDAYQLPVTRKGVRYKAQPDQ
jgi:hypothetical protein